MKNAYQELFALLGLGPHAADCYLAILDLKRARARDVAKATGLHRTILYKPLESLTQHGLITEQIENGVRTYLPLHPDFLRNLMAERTKLVDQAIPDLVQRFSTGKAVSIPKFRFHGDLDGIRSVLEDILRSPSKFYRVIGAFNDEAFLLALGDHYLEDWTKRRIAAGVHHQTLRPPLKESQKDIAPMMYQSNKKYLREVRFANLPLTTPILIYLYDEKVAFVSGRMGSFYASVQESKDLFVTLNSVFDLLWLSGSETPEGMQKTEVRK